LLGIAVVNETDEELAIFCENDVPYACTANGCDIEDDPLTNCECVIVDEELL
jgi:hypothetical protein